MQSIIKHTIYVFLYIFAITALITLGTLVYLWWSLLSGGNEKELPYLGWLVGIVIFEVIGTMIIIAKKGLKYLPDVEVNEESDETIAFMRNFIKTGSSVSIVSNRLAWLRKSEIIMADIIEMAKRGTQFEIITPKEVDVDIKGPLQDAGVCFYVTNEDVPPEARFTLVDGHRSAAEKLAIARGGHPEHEITIFNNNSGPQIIAMAKDIIRKSKGLANV